MPAGLIERSDDEADEDIEAPGPAGPESEVP
jgi:hypothetical protein